jgi:hypothetical protein
MNLLQYSTLGLAILVLAGCGRGDHSAPRKSDLMDPVAQQGPAPKFYQGPMPEKGAAELVILASMG